MRGEPWFKPKTHGYGATPTNWKGWAAIAGYVLVVVVLSVAMLERGQIGQMQIATWMALVLVITGAFVALAKVKTEGAWRWRWGN